MTQRQGWLIVLLCMSSATFAGAEPGTEAERLWRQGQDAMQQGHLDKAIAFYQQSARQDPALARNYLSLAAAYQGKSEDELAALYMAQYLELQPDHFTARAQYADLLLGLNQPTEARQQLDASSPTFRTARSWPGSTWCTRTPGSWRSRRAKRTAMASICTEVSRCTGWPAGNKRKRNTATNMATSKACCAGPRGNWRWRVALGPTKLGPAGTCTRYGRC